MTVLVPVRRVHPPCTVPGCDRPTKSRGLCHRHYCAWRANGDPTCVMPTRRLPIQPLLDIAHLTHTQLAERVAASGTTALGWLTRGVTYHDADRLAVTLGLHPAECWTEWAADNEEVVLA
jgi:hypothetical protein